MNVPILPTLSTTCIVISAILVAIGWRLIWKRQIERHKKRCCGLLFSQLSFLQFMRVVLSLLVIQHLEDQIQ